MDSLVRDYRWALVLRGIVALLFGILALGWPVKTLAVLIFLFGIYAILNGIFAVVFALRNRRNIALPWELLLVEGIVSILAGIVAFRQPTTVAYAFLYLVAAWAIITGVMEIVATFARSGEMGRDWWLALAGLISIIFGLLLAFQPLAGLLTIVWIIGIYAIIFGILFFARYFQIRTLAHSIQGMRGSGLV